MRKLGLEKFPHLEGLELRGDKLEPGVLNLARNTSHFLLENHFNFKILKKNFRKYFQGFFKLGCQN